MAIINYLRSCVLHTGIKQVLCYISLGCAGGSLNASTTARDCCVGSGLSYDDGSCSNCTGEWRVVCRGVLIPSMQCGDSKTALVTLSLSYLSLNLDLMSPLKYSSLLSRVNWQWVILGL